MSTNLIPGLKMSPGKELILAGGLVALVLAILATVAVANHYSHGFGLTSGLPEVSSLDEREANARDEYALLVARYGTPDSLLSTENDIPAPKVPSRIARYDSARVKIVFAPIGCVKAFLKATILMSDAARYPGLADDQIKHMPVCVSSGHGWTIMGYIDSGDNLAIPPDLAELRLRKLRR